MRHLSSFDSAQNKTLGRLSFESYEVGLDSIFVYFITAYASIASHASKQFTKNKFTSRYYCKEGPQVINLYKAIKDELLQCEQDQGSIFLQYSSDNKFVCSSFLIVLGELAFRRRNYWLYS